MVRIPTCYKRVQTSSKSALKNAPGLNGNLGKNFYELDVNLEFRISKTILRTFRCSVSSFLLMPFCGSSKNIMDMGG